MPSTSIKSTIAQNSFSANEFKTWLGELKTKIRQSQLKAAVRVNTELLRLYWDLGRDIAIRKMDSGYGSRFFATLSRELRAEFPEMEGFSERNIRYTKQFYQFYSETGFVQKTPSQILHQLGAESQDSLSLPQFPPIRHQLGDESDFDILFSIPWRHHVEIFTHCQSLPEAIFYIRQTVENGWSRAVLMNFIETGLYAAQGKAINNFDRHLPETQSDLAAEMLKDPYNFDFISLTSEYRERELESALTENIVKFLLELGRGFTFYGRQVALKAGDEDLFADMVFYHLDLRCFVIVELKARPFEAAFSGQLGVYVAAANHQLKRPGDNPSIGLLICKTKNNILAQYALESSSQPIGISEYKLSRLLPKEYKSALPTIAEIETTLSQPDEEPQKDSPSPRKTSTSIARAKRQTTKVVQYKSA